MSIAAALGEAAARLAAASDSARLDAEVLLAHALDRPRSHLHAWPERPLGPDQACRFAQLIERRLSGEPVAYIVGRREFWSLDLMVTPATLIPRPETELLVELALARIPRKQPLAVADLGTGSGAIALAIASERPRARIVATEASPEALAVAEGNARRLGIGNVAFRLGDWCAALGEERFGVIACNPPYLAAADLHLAGGGLRLEPRSALVAGRDGLDAIRSVVAQAIEHLCPGGWLFLEHGHDQGEWVPRLLRAQGYVSVTDHPDLAGIPRVGCGRRPPALAPVPLTRDLRHKKPTPPD